MSSTSNGRRDRHDDQTPKRFLVTRRGFVGGAAATAAALAVGVSPVSRGRQAAVAQEGPSIIIGTLGEASTINPFLANDTEADFRCKMLFDDFVHISPDTYQPQPGIAAEWTLDNLTYVFKIQPNAKFSDGTDLTADDVAFTIKGMLAKTTGSPQLTKYLSIAGAQEYSDGAAPDVSGIVVSDPKTLQITLARPDAPFLYNLHFIRVVPRAMLEGKSLTDDAFFQKPVGAGPFVFESWQTDADFVAVKNPNYWQAGKPALARFTHRTIPDSQSLVAALLAGDIDGSNYPNPGQKAELEANADLSVMVPPFTSPDGFQFNLAHEWLAKKEVRRAIAMSLDMEQFVQDSLYGLGGVGIGPIAPDNWAFDKSLQPIPYDPEGAKALIAQAGMPAGTKIRFMANKGNLLREDWVTYAQQALKPLGIDVQAELIEYATLIDRVENKDFDVNGVVFGGITAEPSELAEGFGTGASGNYSNYSNPQLDALLAQAVAELDIEKAKPIYAQIQAILMDDLPTFFAWYRPFLHTVKKNYTGYTDSAQFGLFYTLEDWSATQ